MAKQTGEIERNILDKKIKGIVEGIYLDVTDRRGIKQAFWGCDEEIIEEIKQAWFDIIKSKLHN